MEQIPQTVSKVEALAWQLLIKNWDPTSPLLTQSLMDECIDTAEKFCAKILERKQSAQQLSWAETNATIAKVEQAYDHGSNHVPGSQSKIGAIKELRKLTGLGLKEAKELVDEWEVKYDWKTRFPGRRSDIQYPSPNSISQEERDLMLHVESNDDIPF